MKAVPLRGGPGAARGWRERLGARYGHGARDAPGSSRWQVMRLATIHDPVLTRVAGLSNLAVVVQFVRPKLCRDHRPLALRQVAAVSRIVASRTLEVGCQLATLRSVTMLSAWLRRSYKSVICSTIEMPELQRSKLRSRIFAHCFRLDRRRAGSASNALRR